MGDAFALFVTALLGGIAGSMVGLGGGVVLVPALRLFFGFGPAEAAGTSLALVVANSASGAFAYLMQKRVHVRTGLLLALGGVPGSLVGAWGAARVSERTFDWLLAALLAAVATDLGVNRHRRSAGRSDAPDIAAVEGMPYPLCLAVGFVVGVVSSLFGIGGGAVVVPSLFYFSSLPAHAIGATSQFAIFLTSPIGLIAHVLQRDVRFNAVVPLVAGGLLGGPIGARLSLRMKSTQLLVMMAIALYAAAASLVIKHVVKLP